MSPGSAAGEIQTAKLPPEPANHSKLEPSELHGTRSTKPDGASFEEGDIIYITDSSRINRWKGGRTQLIPSRDVAEQAGSIDHQLQELLEPEECLDNPAGVNGLDRAGSTALSGLAVVITKTE